MLFLCTFILESKFSSNTLGYLDYLEVKTKNLNKQNNSTIKTLKQYTTAPKTRKSIKKGTQHFDLFYNKDNFKAKRDKNMA